MQGYGDNVEATHGLTSGKLTRLAKFWVMAIVSVRFNTACHQPPGTNIVSPGSWTHSMIATSRISGLAFMRGKRFVK